MQKIPQYPPSEEEDDVGPESVAMVCETTEGVLGWKNAIRKENEEEKRNGENEEVVVGQGFGEMTVEDGMSGTLDATGWTLGACEDPPHALGYERGGRSGIYTIIKDSRHQDGDRNQDSEYVLLVFQQKRN